MVIFDVQRLANNRLRFPGVDMGGGQSTVNIVAEDGPIVVIRTPGVAVYRGPGLGYEYERVRFEVYELSKAGRKGHSSARRLISFNPRRSRANRKG